MCISIGTSQFRDVTTLVLCAKSGKLKLETVMVSGCIAHDHDLIFPARLIDTYDLQVQKGRIAFEVSA